MEICYMCLERLILREYIFFKCIFFEKKDLFKGYNFRKDLIIVFFCDVYNFYKFKDDEYIMFCFVLVM